MTASAREESLSQCAHCAGPDTERDPTKAVIRLGSLFYVHPRCEADWDAASGYRNLGSETDEEGPLTTNVKRQLELIRDILTFERYRNFSTVEKAKADAEERIRKLREEKITK